MSTKNWVIAVVVAGATGIAVGRFTVPVKTVIQTKTVEIASTNTKTDDKTNKKEHKNTKITEVKKPDGSEETTTEIVEDTNTGKDVVIASNTQKDDTSDTKKETKKDSGHMNLSFLAGANPFSGPGASNGIVYGGHVTRDIIGPVNIGVFGFSNGLLGCSVGLTF